MLSLKPPKRHGWPEDVRKELHRQLQMVIGCPADALHITGTSTEADSPNLMVPWHVLARRGAEGPGERGWRVDFLKDGTVLGPFGAAACLTLGRSSYDRGSSQPWKDKTATYDLQGVVEASIELDMTTSHHEHP